jgi:hypothetical protein
MYTRIPPSHTPLPSGSPLPVLRTVPWLGSLLEISELDVPLEIAEQVDAQTGPAGQWAACRVPERFVSEHGGPFCSSSCRGDTARSTEMRVDGTFTRAIFESYLLTCFFFGTIVPRVGNGNVSRHERRKAARYA